MRVVAKGATSTGGRRAEGRNFQGLCQLWKGCWAVEAAGWGRGGRARAAWMGEKGAAGAEGWVAPAAAGAAGW